MEKRVKNISRSDIPLNGGFLVKRNGGELDIPLAAFMDGLTQSKIKARELEDITPPEPEDDEGVGETDTPAPEPKPAPKKATAKKSALPKFLKDAPEPADDLGDPT